jgi:acyl carrier protein
MDPIKERIRQFILTKQLKGVSGAAVPDNARLQSSGLIDSLAIGTVVTFVEKEFEIELSAVDLTIDHFDSIDAIAALVAQKRNDRFEMKAPG